MFIGEEVRELSFTYLFFAIYTHYEDVLGITGQELAWNFDFSLEQNQRLGNAKSRIL